VSDTRPSRRWNIFANPLFVKGLRTQLRFHQALTRGILTFVITGFVFLITYLTPTRQRMVQNEAATTLWTAIWVIQGWILMILGTGSVASGIALEKERGAFDFHRMTPMGVPSKILGYLFGLPAREYFMFLVTVPLMLLAGWIEKISIRDLLHLYLVFFSAVGLYHMLGFVIGMISNKPRQTGGIVQIGILLLYLFLPRLGDLGFTFFDYLTVLPAFSNILSPKETIQGREVPFFALSLPPTLYTLLIQGFLLLSFFGVAYRKWHQESRHAFSKTYALIFFAVLQTFLVGSLWPFLAQKKTHSWLLEQLAGSHALNQWIVLLYLFFLISGALSVLLIHIVTPNDPTFVKGIRRAKKLGLPRVPSTSDAASSSWCGGWFIGLTTISYFSLMYLGQESGRFFTRPPSTFAFLAFPLLFTGLILYVQAAREYWSRRGFFLFLFLLWGVPFFIYLTFWVADRSPVLASYLATPSPMIAFLFAVQNLQLQQLPSAGNVELRPHLPVLTLVSILVQAALAGVFLTLRLHATQLILKQEWATEESPRREIP